MTSQPTVKFPFWNPLVTVIVTIFGYNILGWQRFNDSSNKLFGLQTALIIIVPGLLDDELVGVINFNWVVEVFLNLSYNLTFYDYICKIGLLILC